MYSIQRIVPGLLGVLLVVSLSSVAQAQCSAAPNTLTNGQPTDATQVMANFNHLTTCINSGQLTVPPVSSLNVTGASGGTVTIQNPSATVPYNFNLPAGAGAAGQVLTSGGSGTMVWTNVPGVTSLPLADGIPVGRPAATSLSWLNQGGATDTDYTHGPISVVVPAQSGDQIRGLGQVPPGSTPYTLTVKLDAMLWGTSYYTTGIFIQDSSGKLITLDFAYSSGSPSMQITHWNSTSSFNASPKNVLVNASRTWWLRVNNDGTNWHFYISDDGANWIAFYSEPVTSFLGSTINLLGVYGDNNDTTSLGMNSVVSIWSYELAAGSGTNSAW